MDGTIATDMSLYGRASRFTGWSLLAVVGILLFYIVAGSLMGTGSVGIVGGICQRLLPVWIALIVLFAASITWKRRLGLYGKLFDSTVGMIGFGLVMFWVFVGIFGAMDLIVTHDTLSQLSGMKNEPPGTPLASPEEGQYPWYLLGGDNLARDIFSRIVKGAFVVVQIAPLATLFAFMVGITLGLPAGYYGGRLDVILELPCEPDPRVSRDPALLSAGHARDHGRWACRTIWRRCCFSSR